jgi:protein-S-isoprenylcysteine O-methyltransferase Ste14
MSTHAPDTAGVLAPPPLLFLTPLVAGLLIDRALPAPLLPRPLNRAIGGALMGAGGALQTWFVWRMVRARTPIHPEKPTTTLITDGPFRFSRNPSYLGFLFHYLGVSCLSNSRWPLLLLPLAVLLIQQGVIEREEAYLGRKFGAEYAAYRARVRRWL